MTEFKNWLIEKADYMATSRPTAVNLMWACDQQKQVIKNSASDIDGLIKELTDKAVEIELDDIDRCKKIGDFGATVVPKGATILTHCNAGALACVDYGTALGVIRAARDAGKNINVICDETRPRGQGASLSVWEMQQENIPVKLIPDVASGFLMSQGKIDKVVIGADRIAKGGVVNKVGSFMVALAAKHHDIPFYVAAPYSTFDNEINIYDTIIEERDGDEVRYYGGARICPEGTEVINPAFDITPKELITGIITEKGIIDPI